jgi:protein-L-isoaspartate O-methyltransferase
MARFQDTLRGFDVLEVACGTGYWTAVIAVAARSVVAVDRDPVMAAAARQRLSAASNVRCVVTDAYTLDGISGPFNGAVFEIVKNFPTEPDIVLGLRGMAHTVRYRKFPDEGLWTASYFAR